MLRVFHLQTCTFANLHIAWYQIHFLISDQKMYLIPSCACHTSIRPVPLRYVV